MGCRASLKFLLVEPVHLRHVLFSLSFRLQDGTVCSISNIETKDVYGWIPKGDGDLAGWLR
jgi:hypothetical protein